MYFEANYISAVYVVHWRATAAASKKETALSNININNITGG